MVPAKTEATTEPESGTETAVAAASDDGEKLTSSSSTTDDEEIEKPYHYSEAQDIERELAMAEIDPTLSEAEHIAHLAGIEAAHQAADMDVDEKEEGKDVSE